MASSFGKVSIRASHHGHLGGSDRRGDEPGLIARTPFGRAGEPDELISAIFASNDANYVTGHAIYANGGPLGLDYKVPVTSEAPGELPRIF
jgi:hypothetical protein